ncbi:MAG: SpoIIE family protein phosphatase, partial [Clostridia bacterium]|nr:SpoIIE family protein phosphatase [Clostridia bacterium]
NNVIYVFQIDTSDYKHLISVFNCPNADSTYTAWDIGEEIIIADVEGEACLDVYHEMYENGLKRGTVYRTEDLKGAPPHVTSIIPLLKSDGTTIAALLGVQLPMSELVEGRRNYMIIVAVLTVIIAALVVVAATLFMKLQFVNPLKNINKEAARFAKENSAPDRPLCEKLKSGINEISVLAAAISDMENETLKYIENLSEAISEKQRMGTELRIASLIQEGSVSSVFPAFPDRTEFDLFALMEPAKEVGGDFYDFFMTDDDHIALVMADVSGKGVPAALFMMATKILINERAHVGGTPAEILGIVNSRISRQNKAEMFITVWLGIFEISTGRLIFANAGHDDPAFLLNGGDFNIEKRKHGLAIGAMDGVKYADNEITLNKGDKIFLYTDGVPEATDRNNKMFTAAKMLDALNSDKGGSPESIIKSVRNKVAEFTGDAPQFDDITMLCFEYKGKSGKSIKLTATNDNLGKALDFVRECLKGSGCTEKFVRQTELYVEEVFVNIANYAYSPDTGEAEITVEVFDDKTRITFTDQGKKYDPLSKPDPDVSISADKREIGGLGIFMTKKLTDKTEYEYKDGKNIFITEKNFE